MAGQVRLAIVGDWAILQSNGGDDPFLFFLALFAGGLFAIYWGWRRYRRYTLIRDTPTATVRSMAVGRTELEGRAQPASETFSAPFTDEDCLYADWQVEEYRYDHDDDRRARRATTRISRRSRRASRGRTRAERTSTSWTRPPVSARWSSSLSST
jgi:hypothetical protein